jgi:hypothetical protein
VDGVCRGDDPNQACTAPDLAAPADLGAGDDSSVAQDLGVDLAGVELGGPSMCPAGVVFCDGFEGTALKSAWTVVKVPSGSNVSHDTARAYRGAQSLRVHVGAVAPSSYINVAVQQVPPSPFYVRVYWYLTAQAVPHSNLSIRHSDFGRTYVSPTSNLSLVLTPNGGSALSPSAGKLKVDDWNCVEWAVSTVARDGGARASSRLWVNDVEWTELRYDDLDPPSPFLFLEVGTESLSPPSGLSGFDLWFDEVIIDDKPIGCGK